MRKHLFFDSNQNKYIVLSAIFLLFWYFNYCFPLIWDDYVYSYIFEAGSFRGPLPDSAQRVNGFKDIFISQWNHYFLWGGRTIAHVLAQFFLWQGKSFFNVANSICFVFLLLEMQWIIDKGKINFDFKTKDIVWLFSLLWIFSVFCMNVLTWLTVSCNYLWTLAILLLFLLCYVHILFTPDEMHVLSNRIFLFALGVLAGWTNENTVCFVILVLGCLLLVLKSRKFKITTSKKIYNAMLSGFAGLVLGYLFLILAPGNYVRWSIMLNDGTIFTGSPLLQKNILTLYSILIIRLLLYYYVLRNIFSLHSFYHMFDIVDKKYFYVSIAFFLISIGSLVIMVFAPEFRWRSSFSSLIFLLISGGITRKILSNVVIPNNHSIIRQNVIQIVVRAYIIFTVLFSIYIYSVSKTHNNIIMSQIVAEKWNPGNQILQIREAPSFIENNFLLCFFITGGHLPYVYTLTQDENHWINRDFALYYGIKGIRQKQRNENRE